jgi:hypothetical protein
MNYLPALIAFIVFIILWAVTNLIVKNNDNLYIFNELTIKVIGYGLLFLPILMYLFVF